MNIGINLTSYNSGSMGGLGVYVRSLLLNFPEISKDDTFFVLFWA